MARFAKDKQTLGFRTSDFFKGKTAAAKSQPRSQRAYLADRRVRYTQHKG